MTDQVLKNPDAEAFFQSLIANELIDEREKEYLLYMERVEGVEFTAQGLADSFMDDNEANMLLKPSQIEAFNAIREDAGIPTVEVDTVPTEAEPDTPWYRDPKQLGITAAVGPLGFAWRAGQAAGIDLSGIGNLGSGIAELMAGGEAELAGSKFDSAARQRIITNLEALGYEVDRSEILGDNSRDYRALKEYLEETFDMSRTEALAMIKDGEDAGIAAWNKYKGLEEQLAENAAEEAELEGDEAALARRKAFEILDEDSPGKYVWNSETNQIYETTSGQQVDLEGNIDLDADADTNVWDEAVGTAPWLGLGLGSESAVVDPYTGKIVGNSEAEDNYWSLYDVVQNPDRYNAEASRYLPGGRGFLGGFESDYDVTYQDGAAVSRIVEDWRQGDMPNLRPTRLHAPQIADYNFDSDQPFNARPFYENDDNWSLFAGKSREYIAEVQNTLIRAGALSEEDVVEGSWGPAEATVMKDWLEVANGKAQRWEDVDFDTISNMYGAQAAATRPARAAFTAPAYRSMDPATMESSVQSVMRQMLGRDATSNEIADLGGYLSDQHRGAFVADVQAARQEYDAQGRAIDGGEQSGGEVQDIDFEARFVQKFEETHNAELERGVRTERAVDRQQVVGQSLDNLMNRLGGGF